MDLVELDLLGCLHRALGPRLGQRVSGNMMGPSFDTLSTVQTLDRDRGGDCGNHYFPTTVRWWSVTIPVQVPVTCISE